MFPFSISIFSIFIYLFIFRSNAFVSTPTVEASGQWTTAQMQTPNQNQGVGYSFPWSEIVSDSQRLNNDLLTLLGKVTNISSIFPVSQVLFLFFELM